MKLLILCFILIGAFVVTAEEQSHTVSDSNTIAQNLEAISSTKLISAGLKNFHQDLYSQLNDSQSEKHTFFAPTDSAVASASKVLNALLQRSGYPSLDKLKEEAESRGNKCPSELSPEQCAPWNLNIGISNDEARQQAELYEPIPQGLNITDVGIRFGQANARYHVTPGEHELASFPAHCFYQTLADSQFEDFVRLNGGAQVLHVENIAKAGHVEGKSENKPGDALAERMTPVKILFGVASDPIPKETIDRLQNNASFIPGAVDNNIASIVIPDIRCSNGIIHVIDKVLVLPLNATRVMHSSNLTKFQELVMKAGLQDRLNNELQNITIFAPTNDALDKYMKDQGIQFSLDSSLFFPDTDSDVYSFADESEQNQTLQNLVLHHVVEGSYYPPFIPSETEVKALDGKPLRLNAVNPTSFSVNGINSVKHDILLKNGVMHAISGVLPGADIKGAQGGAGAGGGCAQPGQPVIRPVPGSQVTNGTITPGFSPAAKDGNNPSAKDLGCPEDNAVCRVIDFDFLQCKTQLQTLSQEEREKCNRFQNDITLSNMTSFPNHTQCYNTSTHTCVHNMFLCPLSHPEVCGVQCYNPSEYKCWATMALCPQSAPDKCGDACYHKDKYSCENGQLTSRSGDSQSQPGQQTFDADGWRLNQEVPVHSFRFN